VQEESAGSPSPCRCPSREAPADAGAGHPPAELFKIAGGQFELGEDHILLQQVEDLHPAEAAAEDIDESEKGRKGAVSAAQAAVGDAVLEIGEDRRDEGGIVLDIRGHYHDVAEFESRVAVQPVEDMLLHHRHLTQAGVAGDDEDRFVVGRGIPAVPGAARSVGEHIRLQPVQQGWSGGRAGIVETPELQFEIDLIEEHSLKIPALPPQRDEQWMTGRGQGLRLPAFRGQGQPPPDLLPLARQIAPVLLAG
jgi:hypothetical protein